MLKVVLVIFCLLQIAYQFAIVHIANVYRKKPLPEEVNDIYDEKKYQIFLEYKKDNQKLSFKKTAVSLFIDMVIILSPFFQWIEQATTNVYGLFFLTFTLLMGITTVVDLFFEYRFTFQIEEKYGKNKKTKKEFYKDFLIENGLNYGINLGIFFPLIYVMEHIQSWTHNFSISYGQSFLFTAGIVVLFVGLLLLFSILSIFSLKKQYTFTDLEEGELKEKIVDMMKDSKKKVKKIQVYDESKKSTSKNAFLLKLLNFRQFGIADNFLKENSERELLGVLAHEIGHLKHKKTIWNGMMYVLFFCLFIGIVWLIPNGNKVMEGIAWIHSQFGLESTSYYLCFLVVSVLFSPVFFCIEVFRNYVTRKEEYEADQNAVKEGYGEDLIQLFKQMSKDELIDVNPSPIIEGLTYDHPGMYRRIIALKKGVE